MRYKINGVFYDTFAHIDQKTVSETLRFSLSERNECVFTSFLYCDQKPFPINGLLHVECCIKGDSGTEVVKCAITTNGAVVIPIPAVFCTVQEHLSCEINVSGVDSDGKLFRYKAANIIVAIVE